MEPETSNTPIKQEIAEKSSLHRVTPLSKYLAMALFIISPFLGGWIGYTYAPEKIVEVEKVVEVDGLAEPEKEKSLCEFDTVYNQGECLCPEIAIESVNQLEGKEILFCASEGLRKEQLDAIDSIPSEYLPANEVILPNGMNLEEYLKMRGIGAVPKKSIGQIIQTEPISDFSEWQSYAYEANSFSFAYPSDWKKWELTLDGQVDSVALSPFWESDKVAEYPGTDYPYGLVWIWFEGGGCSSHQFDETVSLDNETEVAVKDYTTDGGGEPNPTYNNKHIVEACYQYGEKLNTASVNLRYVSELNDDTHLEEFWQILSTIGPTVVYPQEGYIESVATPGDAYVLHVRGFDWTWPDNNLLVKKNNDVSEVTVIEDVPLVVNAELKNLILKDEVDVRRMYSDGIEAPLGEVSFFDFAGIYLHQYYHETPIDNPVVVNIFYSSTWGFEYETSEDGEKRLVRITQIYTP